jgi:hypothetical protein
LVSASATARHASCCWCAKRRPGIRDRGRPLPSSRPLARSLCGHTTRSRLADGEAGKIPCLSHKCRGKILGRDSWTYFLAMNQKIPTEILNRVSAKCQGESQREDRRIQGASFSLMRRGLAHRCGEIHRVSAHSERLMRCQTRHVSIAIQSVQY